MAGTPASSIGHRDIDTDNSDMFEVCLQRVCEVHHQKSRSSQLLAANRVALARGLELAVAETSWVCAASGLLPR